MLENPFRGGGKIAEAGADADHQVGLFRQQVRRQAARLADAADVQGVRRDHRPLPGLGFGEGHPVALGETGQRFARAGVFHPAAADDQRFTAGFDGRHGVRQLRGAGRAAVETVHAARKEGFRVIPGFALHILRQAQRYRAGFRRVGQDAHGVDAGAHQLFRAGNAVPVFADCAESVIGADAEIVALFNLLEHRIRLAGGEDIARQQQQWDAVGAGGAGGGDHVGRSRTDGGGAGDNLPAQGLAGKTGGRVGHPLLVAPLIDAHIAAVLLQRLPQPQDVAMAENRENAFHELQLYAIHFQVLVIEELHQRLRRCQSQFAHDAQSLLFSICVWRRADAAGAVVHVTGIPVDYRQTFFSLNTNTEEIFHFARRIKLSTHFIRFTYIPDTFSGPFLPHQTAISP